MRIAYNFAFFENLLFELFMFLAFLVSVSVEIEISGLKGLAFNLQLIRELEFPLISINC